MKKSSRTLRPLNFKKNYLPHAEGSCLVSMGLTQVLCVASLEEKVPPHAEEKGTGWIHAEYAMLPRAGETRSARRRVSGGGRAQEISRLVGRSLRAAVDLHKIPGVAITIDCDVLRADGGTRTASINGGFVALAQALTYLKRKKQILEWPLQDFVGAVSVGVVNNRPFLDMAYVQDKEAQADLNVVMTGRGKLIEVQGTAEGRPFSKKELNHLIDLAHKGINKIVRTQKKVISLPKR